MNSSRRDGNINKRTKLKSFLPLDRRSVSPHRPACSCVRALRGQWATWLAPRLSLATESTGTVLIPSQMSEIAGHAGAVAFPSTCSATDVTIYFLDWSCRSVPCFKFAACVRSFPLFRGLHFFSRSTRYPAKECALWLRECFWIDVERNEDRVQPPSISNRLP